MAKSKKITQQLEANTDTTVEENNAPQQPIAPQAPPTPQFQTDNAEKYRQLLLDFPNRPYIQSTTDAVKYFEELDRWQRKVKLALQ